MAGAVGLWANKARVPRASRPISAVSVCAMPGKKNPLCQNSFPAQEN